MMNIIQEALILQLLVVMHAVNSVLTALHVDLHAQLDATGVMVARQHAPRAAAKVLSNCTQHANHHTPLVALSPFSSVCYNDLKERLIHSAAACSYAKLSRTALYNN
jgi:hypothetical protein